VKATKDGAGRPTTCGYDLQDRLTSSTDPSGRTTTYGYDPAGNVVYKADHGGSCPAWGAQWPPALSPTSRRTVMAYDAGRPADLGRLLRRDDAERHCDRLTTPTGGGPR